MAGSCDSSWNPFPGVLGGHLAVTRRFFSKAEYLIVRPARHQIHVWIRIGDDIGPLGKVLDVDEVHYLLRREIRTSVASSNRSASASTPSIGSTFPLAGIAGGARGRPFPVRRPPWRISATTSRLTSAWRWTSDRLYPVPSGGTMDNRLLLLPLGRTGLRPIHGPAHPRQPGLGQRHLHRAFGHAPRPRPSTRSSRRTGSLIGGSVRAGQGAGAVSAVQSVGCHKPCAANR
jgi:hypothetical protein